MFLKIPFFWYSIQSYHPRVSQHFKSREQKKERQSEFQISSLVVFLCSTPDKLSLPTVVVFQLDDKRKRGFLLYRRHLKKREVDYCFSCNVNRETRNGARKCMPCPTFVVYLQTSNKFGETTQS